MEDKVINESKKRRKIAADTSLLATKQGEISKNLFSEFQSQEPNIDFILALINHLEDPNVIEEFDNDTLLHSIVISNIFGENFTAIVKALLAKGAQLNNPQSFNPLHYACFWSCLEAVKVFIKYGADVNAPDHEGKSPLHYAIYCDDYGNDKADKNIIKEICFILIINGADPSKAVSLEREPFVKDHIVQEAMKRAEEQKNFNRTYLPSLTLFSARAVLKNEMLKKELLPSDCQKVLENYEENYEAKRFMGIASSPL